MAHIKLRVYGNKVHTKKTLISLITWYPATKIGQAQCQLRDKGQIPFGRIPT